MGGVGRVVAAPPALGGTCCSAQSSALSACHARSPVVVPWQACVRSRSLHHREWPVRGVPGPSPNIPRLPTASRKKIFPASPILQESE